LHFIIKNPILARYFAQTIAQTLSPKMRKQLRRLYINQHNLLTTKYLYQNEQQQDSGHWKQQH
jgi:hypothetical protein